jgi:hypothetical protein
MLHKMDHFGEQYKITSRKANCTPTTTTVDKSNGHIHIRRNLVHPNHRTRSRTRTIGTFSGTPGKGFRANMHENYTCLYHHHLWPLCP